MSTRCHRCGNINSGDTVLCSNCIEEFSDEYSQYRDFEKINAFYMKNEIFNLEKSRQIERENINQFFITRVCYRCKRELPHTPFYYHRYKRNTNGLAYTCKECLGFTFKASYRDGLEDYTAERRCRLCKKVYPLTPEYYHYNNKMKNKFNLECKQCCAERYEKECDKTKNYRINIACVPDGTYTLNHFKISENRTISATAFVKDSCWTILKGSILALNEDTCYTAKARKFRSLMDIDSNGVLQDDYFIGKCSPSFAVMVVSCQPLSGWKYWYNSEHEALSKYQKYKR